MKAGRPSLRRRVRIVNRRGLHARAAAQFVKLAQRFDAAVTVTHQGACVSAHSIMGLLMLAAAPGCELELTADGPEAAAAMEALARLVTAGFGEDAPRPS